jgi:hypothetical protein
MRHRAPFRFAFAKRGSACVLRAFQEAMLLEACISSRISRDSTPRQFAQTFVLLILFSGLTTVKSCKDGRAALG